MSRASFTRIREQARIQCEGRQRGELRYELLQPVKPNEGLAALPAPCPGDVFLDLEANAFAFEDGLEYLFGTLVADGEDQTHYQPRWALDRASEKIAFQDFMGGVMERWHKYPDMHIYHYAPYEPTALKRLAGRHLCCVEELDGLLRAEKFVDLYRVVRQSLRASVESYSIKKIEALYQFVREVPLAKANTALNAYEAVLVLGRVNGREEEFRKTIQGYNRDDCMSTLRLRDWLEARRSELESSTGQRVPRPEPKSPDPGDKLADDLRKVAELRSRLTSNIPEDPMQRTPEQGACWLLAEMLEWHRREDKSSWWEYFERCGMSDEELQEDRGALGGLAYEGPREKIKQSTVYRFSFPSQDFRIKLGRNSHDPRIRTSPGEIVDIDVIRQTIDIKRKSTSQPPDCTALIPDDIVDAKPAKGSLMRLAQWVADHSISAPGPLQACRDLLQRKPPQALHEPIPVLIDEDQQLTPATRDLVLSLVSQPAALPIQGPPGSGKTFTAAKMILELVKEGHRVGVTAVSHKVIVNLLEELCRLKQSGDKSFRVIQKITDKKEEQACTADSVDVATNNAEVVEALSSKQAQIAAGTAWLWACEDMANSVDVLFVDEAGQMSLANTLAIGQAATSMVLLGDPQQLDQPKRGLHPPGTEVSALGHILAGEKTIKPTQGLFLAQTFRMHPAVCSFISEMFYDNLLLSRPENATQRILCNGPLAASGLRFVPVIHEGNQNESAEEGEAVLALITNLLAQGAQWTDKHGNTHLLRARDFLVVAPYNAQVAALTALLPPGVRVGTVDKFQGQQAPIVIYSMATSSPEDAPRGMEFLYSLNRLNVAVSRAQTLAILVASPALFHVPCNTPRQIELVNAFCRYMEIARPPVPWRMQAAAR